jgi:hypothetical protein
MLFVIIISFVSGKDKGTTTCEVTYAIHQKCSQEKEVSRLRALKAPMGRSIDASSEASPKKSLYHLKHPRCTHTDLALLLP